MDFWKIFPQKEELLKWYEEHGDGQVRLVNAHMHSPYSFSAFTDITQALDMAVNENVKVAGINDFYTTDGYKRYGHKGVPNEQISLVQHRIHQFEQF